MASPQHILCDIIAFDLGSESASAQCATWVQHVCVGSGMNSCYCCGWLQNELVIMKWLSAVMFTAYNERGIPGSWEAEDI